MYGTLQKYGTKFLRQQEKRKQGWVMVFVLCCLVASGVAWKLRLIGVALNDEASCGKIEHQHTEACMQRVLVCGQEEGSPEILQAESNTSQTVHHHTDACYEIQYVCGQEEHLHTLACYADLNADVETAADWEATLPENSGVWAEDLLAVAQSQLNYVESSRNYVIAEDGETKQGYTRYGACYGNPYGDWNGMFAAFCLRYAKIPDTVVPQNAGAFAMRAEAAKRGLLADAAYVPQPGDLVFLSDGLNPSTARVGILSAVEEETLQVIQGDVNHTVAQVRCNQAEVTGYIDRQKVHQLAETLHLLPELPNAEEKPSEEPPIQNHFGMPTQYDSEELTVRVEWKERSESNPAETQQDKQLQIKPLSSEMKLNSNFLNAVLAQNQGKGLTAFTAFDVVCPDENQTLSAKEDTVTVEVTPKLLFLNGTEEMLETALTTEELSTEKSSQVEERTLLSVWEMQPDGTIIQLEQVVLEPGTDQLPTVAVTTKADTTLALTAQSDSDADTEINVTTQESPTGALWLEQEWKAPGGTENTEETFPFRVTLYPCEGETLENVCYTVYSSYQDYEENDKILIAVDPQPLVLDEEQTGTISLQAGQFAVLQELPVGTKYTVTAQNTGHYKITLQAGTLYEKDQQTYWEKPIGAEQSSGKIQNGKINRVHFTSAPEYQLPATGGMGKNIVLWVGVLCMLGAVGNLYQKGHRKEGGTVTTKISARKR